MAAPRRPPDGPTHAPSRPDLPDEPATEGWIEARVEGADHSGAAQRSLLIADTELIRCNLANARFGGAELSRVLLRGCRMTGISLADSALRDVVFADCRIDLASFAGAKFERVVLSDCLLTQSDLQGSQLHDVRFERCDLTEVDLMDASARNSEMRGCTLTGLRGVESLRHIGMPWPDILGSADVFAAALGVRVLED